MSTEQTENETEEREELGGGELVYRVSDPAALHFRAEANESNVIEGRMMPYDEWSEVRSSIEGHFLERFAPGSLAKTMSEQGAKIRALFEHGLDKFGRQAIADINELRDEPDGAYYRATLLDGLPALLISGIRQGLYGTSVRFEPVKWDRVRFPKRSEHNPDRLPEHTIREAFVKEFSVTTFPLYAGATAHMRSLTDEVVAQQLLGDPSRLLEIIQKDETTEPPHSVREEQEDPAPERSRSTQPSRDYLRPEEGEPSWRL